LWSEFNLEEVATPEGFVRDPAKVHAFYNLRRRRQAEARPNSAHRALARLERDFPGQVLTVTQNIDALQEAAAKTCNLIHMHGELARVRCDGCGLSLPWEGDLSVETLCKACRMPGLMRPDVVWFGEMPRQMERIYEALETCDLFLSIGTSGTVFPAAGFVFEAKNAGAYAVELNLEPSEGADLFEKRLHRPATTVVPACVERLLAR
jgi:NAD-dependent deacetylase